MPESTRAAVSLLMTAEIGISTQKLHARGPMALRELTTTKWVVEGEVAYFGFVDGLRERSFSSLTPPHCGTNYTVVLSELLLIDEPSVARPIGQRLTAVQRAVRKT